MALEPDLSRYVTDVDGDVYAIVGLPEEILAVVFAYVSRSPRSFRENLLQVTAERAEQFHEKWVLHYGHASVAEHASIHLGIERLSRYASAVLEDSRLISVTEYSQRYQEPRAEDVHVPSEVRGSPLEETVRATLGSLYELYRRLLDDLAEHLRGESPAKPDEEPAAYARRLRRRAFEDARYVLPLATTTSLGLTTNAREMEHVISKCLSHRSTEVRGLGEAMRTACRGVAPTLIKYASPLPYRMDLERRCQDELDSLAVDAGAASHPSSSSGAVELIDWTGRGEPPRAGESPHAASERAALRAVLTAFLEPGAADRETLRRRLESSSGKELAARYARLLGEPLPHESLPRELETVAYTFHLTLSEAAWHQLLRHRMMSCFPAEPGIDLGLCIPPLIEAAGRGELMKEAHLVAERGFMALERTRPEAAPYMVTNAHLRRVRIVMNLRQLYHLTRLRMSAHAQWDIRAVSASLLAETRRVHAALLVGIPPEA